MSPGTPLLALASILFGWPLIIRLIIQTIGLYPSGAIWTDEASNVSRLDPSGALQADCEHPSRNRKVVGSNPTSSSKTASTCVVRSPRALLVWLDHPSCANLASERPAPLSCVGEAARR